MIGMLRVKAAVLARAALVAGVLLLGTAGCADPGTDTGVADSGSTGTGAAHQSFR